jgi:hypothetical protein
MVHLQLTYICKVCDYAQKEKYVARNHITTVHGRDTKDIDNPLITACGICFVRDSSNRIKSHIKKKHFQYFKYFNGQKRYKQKNKNTKCDYCDADFTGIMQSTQRFKGHMQNVHIKPIYKCNLCDFQAKAIATVYNHNNKNHLPHNLDKKDKNAWKRLNVKLKCNVCGFEVACIDKSDLFEHMKANHEDKINKTKLVCDKCEFGAGGRMQLNLHTKKKHPNMYSPKITSCDYCSADFHGQKQYSSMRRSHIQMVHVRSIFKCNECNFQNKMKQVLRRHIQQNHLQTLENGNKQTKWQLDYLINKCSVCGLEIAHKYEANMMQHMQANHEDKLKERNVSCSECGFIAGCLRLLTVHQKIKHTTCDDLALMKRFHCPQCTYNTNQSNRIRFHMQKHIVAFYSCNICNLKSIDKKTVVTHFIVQHKVDIKQNTKKLLDKLLTVHCKLCDFEATNTEFYCHL